MSRLLHDTFDTGHGFTDAQFARPAIDLSNVTWTPSSGSSLSAMLNEETPDDATFITSGAAVVDDQCTVRLSAMMEPHPGPVTIRVRGTLV